MNSKRLQLGKGGGEAGREGVEDQGRPYPDHPSVRALQPHTCLPCIPYLPTFPWPSPSYHYSVCQDSSEKLQRLLEGDRAELRKLDEYESSDYLPANHLKSPTDKFDCTSPTSEPHKATIYSLE